jgi:signal transduction histidine kinase
VVTKGSGEIECRLIGYDGVTRWVWTRAVARLENGRLFADGISTNVTERRQLAEQREQLLAREQHQVRQLRKLDRLKDELVAVVSHELRNPIAVIRGYLELLRKDSELSADQQEYLAVVDDTSAHLQRLADDLLDLARLEAGHITIDAGPVPVDILVREAAGDHRPAASAKGIDLRVDASAAVLVRADRGRLRQVLDNLLSNAVKYTPPTGTVTVAATGAGSTVLLTVTDTGIGIPAEQYPQLFTRFFRASTALSEGITGTGLGLAVSKAIVEAHGGAINAEPAPGGGTRFAVRLPATS